MSKKCKHIFQIYCTALHGAFCKKIADAESTGGSIEGDSKHCLIHLDVVGVYR